MPLAGHAVPTGAAFLRRIWVDVELTDANAAALLLPAVLELGARATRAGAEVPLLTDADAVVSRALAPGEARTVRVTLPTGAPWLRARAVLRARAISGDALAALGLGGRAAEVPVLEVTAKDVTLPR